MTSLTIGGATAASCETCGARIGATCLSPSGAPCKKPHAARVRSAPPETTAHVGDLIEVHGTNGIHVAHLHAITDASAVVVRYWKPGAQRFGPPTPVRSSLVVRIVGDTAKARIAREELREEARIAGSIRFTGEPAETPPPVLAPDLLAGRGPFDPALVEPTSDRGRDKPPRPDEVLLDDKGRPSLGQYASALADGSVSMPEDPWFNTSTGTTKPAKGSW